MSYGPLKMVGFSSLALLLGKIEDINNNVGHWKFLATMIF